MDIPVDDALLQIFDVEHGACALLTCRTASGAIRLMVDCGHNASTKWYPGTHLRQLGVSSLEQLVITNYDEDHVSGYPNLLSQGIFIDWIMRNVSVTPQTIRTLKTEDGMGVGIETLINTLDAFLPPGTSSGTPHQFPGVTYEAFINRYPSFDDENNLSLVLYLTVHGTSFLFPGDMETAGFEYLLSTNPRFRTITGQIDVLIASHHGRENGICDSMFSKWNCRPSIVVISDDYKQYSTQETSAWYGQRCSGVTGFRNQPLRKVLSTRSDGEIRFSFANGTCRAC
jgi:beta-lactamase superfamily II metal-dependent hydrolase